ncbi:MAG TPA: chitinase [Pseudonocardiaceae bacterium]
MPIRSRLTTTLASRRKVLVVAAALLPIGLGLATATTATAQHAPSVISNSVISNAAAAGTYAVAPYVDMGESDESLLNTAISSKGLKAYTAAFVIGEGCTQIWGDTEPIGKDPFIDPEIAKAKSAGGSLIVSSGGADGYSIPWTCTNQSTINSSLQNIITTYGAKALDFDIEGAAVADTTSATRLYSAMKTLKASNPGLVFSITIPVTPTGMDNYGVGLVQAAQKAGVKIDVINLMAMDYYAGTGEEMGTAAVNAAKGALAQMKAINSSYSYANVGLTPMIGVNDDGSTFSLNDAKTVESFAASNGLGRLSYWSLTRDQSCGGSAAQAVARPASSPTCSGVSQASLAFTSAFAKY